MINFKKKPKLGGKPIKEIKLELILRLLKQSKLKPLTYLV